MTMEWQLPNSNGHLKFISEFQLGIQKNKLWITNMTPKLIASATGNWTRTTCVCPVVLFTICCHTTFLTTFVWSNELKFYLKFDLLSNELLRTVSDVFARKTSVCYLRLPTFQGFPLYQWLPDIKTMSTLRELSAHNSHLHIASFCIYCHTNWTFLSLSTLT